MKYLLYCIIFFLFLKSNQCQNSEIIITFNTYGKVKYINKDFNSYIYINEIQSNDRKEGEYYINLNDNEKTIKLVWNNSISLTSNMFKDCVNISQMNFSSFDSSSVSNMSTMFYGCSSLVSLDLSKFNTQNVENMKYMFNGCS